jgi:hypothetical protein
LVILGFGLGFWLRPIFYSAPRASPESPRPEQSLSASQTYQVLTPEMIEDYYRLQSLEEKYKKADELLAKIIVALLHDLGFKLSPETQATVEKTARGEKPLSAESNQESSGQQRLESNLRPEVGVNETHNKEAPIKNKWSVQESGLDQVQTANQALEFLEKVKIGNLDEELKTSSSFKNTQQLLENINGKYEGTADVFFSGKPRLWQLEIDMDLRMNQSLLKGRSQIKLSENGRVFSNSTDRGEPKNLREFSKESVALMIRASPSIIFQAYYLKTSDSFIGNVYRLDGDEINYQYVGTLKLFRKN